MHIFRGNPTLKVLLTAVMAVLLFAVTSVKAGSISPTMTQGELIGWMVSLSGDSCVSTADALVAWAKTQGIIPAGGWQPNAVLTKDVLAQVLVQFLNFKVKAGTDPLKALQREGINLPGLTSASELTRKDVVSMFDRDGLQPRAPIIEGAIFSPWKPFPGNANGGHNGWDNPNNPHSGSGNPGQGKGGFKPAAK